MLPVAVKDVPAWTVLQVTKNPVVVFVVATVTDVTEAPPDDAANVHDDPDADTSNPNPNPDGA